MGAPPSTEVSTGTATTIQRKIAVDDIDALTVPACVDQHFVYLRGILQGHQEDELLLNWLALECQDEVKSVSKLDLKFLLSVLNVPPPRQKSAKLAATSRPKVISAWLRDKLRPGDKIPEFDIEELKEEWRKWWMSLMPEWRLAGKSTDADDAWPMKQDDAWNGGVEEGPQDGAVRGISCACWGSPSGVLRVSLASHRNRPARSSEPALQSEAELNGAAVRRSSTRTSHPTKRKLGISDLSPSEPRSAKRRSLGA